MAELYKIGVEIALAGTILQGLEGISAKLLGVHTKVAEVDSMVADVLERIRKRRQEMEAAGKAGRA
jgi:hypothetical protein